jgi:hypothetical protein
MRRTTFVALGVMEILSAAVLFAFVWQLPGPSDVHDKVGRIERVSRQTAVQIRKLRNEVRGLRQGQPHAEKMARDLHVHLQDLSDQLQKQRIDYTRLRGVHDAFGNGAVALESLCDRPAPEGVAVAALALGGVADVCQAVGAPDAARVLQSGRRELDRSVERWPEVQNSLRTSAAALRETQANLKNLLDNRPGYEDSFQRSRTVLEGLSAAVPMYTAQLGKDMEDQERSLSTLGANIDEVTAVMPEIKVQGARLLVMMRLLLSLVGAIFLLHGGYLAINSWMQQTTAAPGEPAA